MIINVKIPEAIIAFEGQTKEKLATKEASKTVAQLVEPAIMNWLQENNNNAQKIIRHCLLNQKIREQTKKLKQSLSTSNKKTGPKAVCSAKLH